MKVNQRILSEMPDDVDKMAVWRGSKLLRSSVVSVLKGKLEQAVIESESKQKYHPGWTDAMADNLGYRRCLREMIIMLEDS